MGIEFMALLVVAVVFSTGLVFFEWKLRRAVLRRRQRSDVPRKPLNTDAPSGLVSPNQTEM